jgi:alcohol dehydrogenase class IV
MSLASLFGGMVIQGAGTCGGHAAAYAFAVKHNIPHGISCALVLPYFMEFNALSCPEKIAEIGYTITHSRGCSQDEAVKIAIKSVIDLMKKINIPTSLKELGIKKKDLTSMAEDIFKATRLLVNNPRSMSKEDSINIFTKMWEGRIDI